MSDELNIKTSIFFGIKLNKKLQFCLQQSPPWKQALIDPTNELIEIDHQGKQYLGCNIGESISLETLSAIEHFLREKITLYCPQHPLHTTSLTLIARILIP